MITVTQDEGNVEVQASARVSIRGHFTLIAINADTGEERLVADFDNLIVNQGLNMLGDKATIPNLVNQIGACSVGTGNTPESPTDTVMESYLAATSTVASGPNYTYNTGTTPWYSLSATTWQFGVGVAAGNLTEIGMVATVTSGPVNSASPLFAHTLIRAGGVPVTITILSNEILNVIYTPQMFINTTDFTGTFPLNIDGTPTTFNYDMRPMVFTSTGVWAVGSTGFTFSTGPIEGSYSAAALTSDFAFGVVNAYPTGTNQNPADTVSVGTYVQGTFTQTFTHVYHVASAVFSGGIGGFYWWSSPAAWQLSVSPTIPKTNLQQLTMNFSIAWSD